MHSPHQHRLHRGHEGGLHTQTLAGPSAIGSILLISQNTLNDITQVP